MNIQVTEKDHILLRIIALLVPDIRTSVVVAYFVLSFRLLYMVEANEKLLANAAFMTIATLIVGSGGLGLVAMFYFGGTKTGSEVMKAQSDQLISTAPIAVVSPVVEPEKPDGT